MAAFSAQTLTIEGMEHAEAVHGVTRALACIPGVRVDSVEQGRVRILAEAACERPIRDALAQSGFALAAAECEHAAES